MESWVRDFLLSRPAHTAKVATVRADGRPHVAPVWFDLDGDDVMFTTPTELLVRVTPTKVIAQRAIAD